MNASPFGRWSIPSGTVGGAWDGSRAVAAREGAPAATTIAAPAWLPNSRSRGLRQLRGGAHDRAIHEVDRRPRATLFGHQLPRSRERCADRLHRLTVLARVRVSAGGDRHVEHRERLVEDAAEERRTDEARVSVHARETARKGDRRTPQRRARGRQALAVEKRGHRP